MDSIAKPISPKEITYYEELENTIPHTWAKRNRMKPKKYAFPSTEWGLLDGTL